MKAWLILRNIEFNTKRQNKLRSITFKLPKQMAQDNLRWLSHQKVRYPIPFIPSPRLSILIGSVATSLAVTQTEPVGSVRGTLQNMIRFQTAFSL